MENDFCNLNSSPGLWAMWFGRGTTSALLSQLLLVPLHTLKNPSLKCKEPPYSSQDGCSLNRHVKSVIDLNKSCLMHRKHHPLKICKAFTRKIRVYLISSTQHSGISLNNMLLTGPNLNNSGRKRLLSCQAYSKCSTALWCEKSTGFTWDSCGIRTMMWQKKSKTASWRFFFLGSSCSPPVAIYRLWSYYSYLVLWSYERGCTEKQNLHSQFCGAALLHWWRPSIHANWCWRFATQNTALTCRVWLHKFASNSQSEGPPTWRLCSKCKRSGPQWRSITHLA